MDDEIEVGPYIVIVLDVVRESEVTVLLKSRPFVVTNETVVIYVVLYLLFHLSQQ